MRYTLMLTAVASTIVACSAPKSLEHNSPVDFSQVVITDNFWQPRIKTLSSVTLPACLDQCETKTHRIDNFAVAAGMQQGSFEGLFYDDSDLYKMIEGISCSLRNNPDSVMQAKLETIITKIAAAQQPDGYLDTYYILKYPDQRWTDMDKHEMYCCGHLIEAAIAYNNATGSRALLDVAVKFADHLCDRFGQGKAHWVPGHPEIELALIKLYRATGCERYLDLSHQLLEERGHNHGTWSDKEYYLDLCPVADLQQIGGHAVRAMYLFTGMADYAAATGDTTYMASLDRLWDDVVGRKMYLTGGIGSSRQNEGFTEPYDLPNQEAYCETCASVGMAMWNSRMNMLKGESRYADIMERAMYNGALAGISLSGDRFFYVNPLYSAGDHHRQPWYGTACCPSQISRFLPSVGGYIYALSDNSVWVNLYVGSQTEVKLGKTSVAVAQQTEYPWSGKVNISVDPRCDKSFALRLRVPEWCQSYSLAVNGEPVGQPTMADGYLIVERRWQKGDKVQFDMDMSCRLVAADSRVKQNVGRRAVMRGPMVYCIEQVDNDNFDDAALDAQTILTSQFEPDLLGGVETILAQTATQTLKFVPYYAWDNRQEGKMEVWVPYND